MTTTPSVPLLLDEMFSARVADALRGRGHSIIAVAERLDLRAATDHEIFAWAAARHMWLATENVKDFRPIVLRAMQAQAPVPGLLFTSSRTFPRSRTNPGPLTDALHSWLVAGPPAPPVTEDWLTVPGGGSG